MTPWPVSWRLVTSLQQFYTSEAQTAGFLVSLFSNWRDLRKLPYLPDTGALGSFFMCPAHVQLVTYTSPGVTEAPHPLVELETEASGGAPGYP